MSTTSNPKITKANVPHTPRNELRRQPADVDHSQLDNVQYILSSEFDNKKGADLKYQYPHPIPGFELPSNEPKTRTVAIKSLPPSSSSSSTTTAAAVAALGPFHLANMMIPDSIEREAGIADFTVFVLYWNAELQRYQFIPSQLTPIANDGNGNGSNTKKQQKQKDKNSSSSSSKGSTTYNGNPDKIFFMNAVKMVPDKHNERGSKVRSVAIGTTMRNFNIFKPALLGILDRLMDIDSDSDRYLTFLAKAFDSINKLDLSLLRELPCCTRGQQQQHHYQRILQSVAADEGTVRAIFDPDKGPYRELLGRYSNSNKCGNVDIKLDRVTYTLPDLAIARNNVTLSANLIDGYCLDDIPISARINSMLLKFLSHILPAFQRKPARWRLIVTSTKLSKDILTQFVLALSTLTGCFPFSSLPVLALPYVNISFVDTLRDFDFSMIIGTVNPIFKNQENAWEFYYDLDEQLLYTNTTKQMKQRSPFLVDLKRSPTWLRRLSLKGGYSNRGDTVVNVESSPIGVLSSVFTELVSPVSSNNSNNNNNNKLSPLLLHTSLRDSSSSVSLAITMVSHLTEGGYCYQVMMNTLRRVNVLQIIAVILSSKFPATPSSWDLFSPELIKAEYETTFKDFSIFPFFFQRPYIDFIVLLSKLMTHFHTLRDLSSGSTRGSNSLFEGLSRLNGIASLLYSTLDAKDQTITEQLMVTMLNFPDLSQLPDNCGSLQTNEFLNVYLSRLSSDTINRESIIAQFAKVTCFESLFSMLSCGTKKKPATRATTAATNGDSTGSGTPPGSSETVTKTKSSLPHLKHGLRRTRSLKDLLAFNTFVYPQRKDSSSINMGSNATNSSTPSVASSGHSANATSGEDLSVLKKIDDQVLELKQTICKIIYIIEGHTLGKVLLHRYVSRESFDVYEKLKSKLFQTFTIREESENHTSSG